MIPAFKLLDRKSKSKLTTLAMTALSCILCVILCSCSQNRESFLSQSAERRLCIAVDVENGEVAKFKTITPDHLGGNFESDITYLGLTNVYWQENGTIFQLEDAIRDGIITVEEIFAFARIDARNGICTEVYTSRNGLAYFTYQYPEFDLRMTYDIYETPDGQKHLINDIGIYKTGADVYTRYADDVSGVAIDREDWGLCFQVEAAAATKLTINCTQSGGQQIGELEVDYDYNIYSVIEEQMILLPTLQDTVTYTPETLPPPIVQIKSNDTTQFTIDWTEQYEALNSGKYKIQLTVNDIFDESQLHPLMKDYYVSQTYWIDFTIP